MFFYTEVLLQALIDQLNVNYDKSYRGYKEQYKEIINWTARMALENISLGDALYHNVEHTIHVTLVGQEILLGKHQRTGGVTCEDWLHFTISLLCHDIGYIKGVCNQDDPENDIFATGVNGEIFKIPPGSSGAALTPFHVDRGKLFIEERFGHHRMIDAEKRWGQKGGIDVDTIISNIELTRFPVPKDEDHQDTENYPGLLRAADLIGQLSDPRYLFKVNALYYEFEEIGMNRELGYKHPGDLHKSYPRFFWKISTQYLHPALDYLKTTEAGRNYLANLYCHVFEVEHRIK